ncbi:hypothetical protein [Nocardioides sp. P5_C9_2]
MNTAPADVRPEVARFVAAVRARFADLDDDEREELLGGLEADVTERVAEEGADVLGDPDAYAAELRSAAGLPPGAPVQGVSWSGSSPRAVLDAAAARSSQLLDGLPGDAGGLLRAARPAWWVFRAWLAVMLVSFHLWLPRDQDVPYLPTGSAGAGAVVLLAAALVSVQVGRGRLWPGTRSTAARLVLLALNLFALAVLPNTVQNVEYIAQAKYYDDLAPSIDQRGVVLDGEQVCNIQPYAADGRPLVGVQLFDGRGRPLDVRCPDRFGTGAYPWTLGDVSRWNVFPQAERRQQGFDRTVPDAYDSARPPAFPTPERAEVPEVTHPLVMATPGDGRAAGRRAAGTGR